MMHPFDLKISDYNYDLPEEYIAQYPVPERDKSRLLVYNRGEISESYFFNLSDYIEENSLIIFNNTKVIHSRIIFHKDTGAEIEIFCLEPYEEEIQTAFTKKGSCRWKCLLGNATKWKKDILATKYSDGEKDTLLYAEKLEILSDCFLIEFRWQPENLTFAEILEHAGKIPLPPYIKREPVESDKERYQTIYADVDGSVASPTAGLHFTGNVLETLERKGVQFEHITLHIGTGTFKPVKSLTLKGHKMHPEKFLITKSFIEKLLNCSPDKIILVGTTSVRTLESLYWLGLKLITNKNNNIPLKIKQWDYCNYNTEQISNTESLKAIINYMNKRNTDYLYAETQILIAPGYDFRFTKKLITNFHRPRSTLLLLIAAFIGDDWKKVYSYAINNKYRLLSYGDSSLLIK